MTSSLQRIIIRVNNWLLRLRKRRLAPERVMILLPRCLQNAECKQNIVEDSNECKQCGRCLVGAIVALGEQYHVRIQVATGGLMARDYVKKYNPRLIIAVACESELTDGLSKTFPKPVYALINDRPNGPCKNTVVDINRLEEALRMFIAF